MDRVSHFLANHPCLHQVDEFSAICTPLNALGISYFSHVRVFDNHEFACFSQSSKFLDYYVNQEYFNFDAHRIKPVKQEQYMLWDVVEKKEETLTMHQDFNHHGYGHTFTIMNHLNTYTDYYNFAAPFGNDSINNHYINYLAQLKAFINYFSSVVKAHKSLNKAYELTLPYTQVTAGYMTAEKHTPDFSSLDSIQSMEKISIPGTQSYLTRREFDCLHWVALGKTQEQVGEIMTISVRTVKAHLKNIKEKLQCYNQFQLGMQYVAIKSQLGISS